MDREQYRTAPLPIATMPPGIPFIVGNEAAERFSFYGMRGILVVFMTKYLLDATGERAPMSDEEAKYYFHLFEAAAYLCSVFGGLLADVFLGKYRTIIYLSIVYCLGHVALAADETRLGLAVGLSLIAVGSGGIKPCVSAHVGDQFGSENQHLVSRVFSWFYFAINFGAFFSMMITPWLLDRYGPRYAFGLPGVLMFLATLVFWLGRNRYVHIPAGGIRSVQEALGPEGRSVLLNLVPLFVFVAAFWSLFDQPGSAWVLQAEQLDRNMLGTNWRSEEIQAVNPVFILLFIPLFSYVIYPIVGRVVTITPLRKVGTGLFIASASFAIVALVQVWIDQGETPSAWWQVLATAVLTAAEVLVSITCLEFSYTQAPPKMKSFVMALYMLSVSAGNLFTALVNKFMISADGTNRLEGASYYWFFTILMFATAAAFVVFSTFYRGKTYLQDQAAATDS
jgi:proton-dependent oligopeptide transporter, POT family